MFFHVIIILQTKFQSFISLFASLFNHARKKQNFSKRNLDNKSITYKIEGLIEKSKAGLFKQCQSSSSIGENSLSDVRLIVRILFLLIIDGLSNPAACVLICPCLSMALISTKLNLK